MCSVRVNAHGNMPFHAANAVSGSYEVVVGAMSRQMQMQRQRARRMADQI
jgi:hypothetical protein